MKPTLSTETSVKRKPRWKRVLKRILITLGVIIVVLVFGVFPYWVATLATGAKTRPADRQLTETPATLGAEYRDVEFQTADGIKISGWLLASRSRRATIIYSHGLFRSRRELLPRAVDLWKLGYGALLYDSRNHGTSGPGRVSLGYHERLDAQAAIRFLRDEERSQDRIVLFGISMGAATAMLAAAESAEVAAVVSDSSFLSLKDTIDHHIRAFLRLPAFPLSNEVRFFIEQRADFDGSKLDVVEAVRRIGDRPVLFIAGANDRRMPPEMAQKLYETSSSPKKDLLIVDGPATGIHGHAYQAGPAAYVEKVAQFLSSALDSNS
jgi:fermentation-respiration switch protein FrsA (DUF1100 family)